MTAQGYQHRADRSAIPVCRILGVGVAALDMEQLVQFTEENLPALSGDYICAANVHTAVMAFEDAEYRAVQNGGILAIPDGGPLAREGRRRGFRTMARTPCPSYMEEIFRRSAEKGYRHYFYGSTHQTLGTMFRQLSARYPGLAVAGLYSPPFRPMTPEEDAAAVARINRAGADFVWVGLGAPKQERWMAAHQGQIRGLMVGAGAGFAYLAGSLKRAPRWMQEHDLEWAFRLVQDPRRLLGRYLRTNTTFLWQGVFRGR